MMRLLPHLRSFIQVMVIVSHFAGSVASCMLFMPMMILSDRVTGLQFLIYAGIGVGVQIPTAFLLHQIHKSLGQGLCAVATAPVAPDRETGQGEGAD